MTRFYPVFADVEGRTCLVVGGGRVAEERAARLAASGARVRLVAPRTTQELARMVAQSEITEHRQRVYAASDMDGCHLAIAATDSREVNRGVHADARARGVWCNVADDPGVCDFILPSVVRRGDLTLAVSTGGASPVVAADVRRRLEESFGPEWGTLIEILGDSRDALKRRHPEPAQRSSRVRSVLESDVLDLLARGDCDAAERRVRELLDVEDES